VFYDGHCGLCHRAVVFALRRDTDGRRFRFSPLQGTTFSDQIFSRGDAETSDSIIVVGPDGSLLQQSDAVILILEALGGGWGRFGRALSFVPRLLRDLAYRGVANSRPFVFRQTQDLCPLVPSTLTNRFLP